MKLLDQLRREQTQLSGSSGTTPKRLSEVGDASQPVVRAIEALYLNLSEFAEGLNQLQTDVRVDYEIDSCGCLFDLRQRRYAVLDKASETRFDFVFECVGSESISELVSTVTERERLQEKLTSFELTFSVDGSSAIRYAIVIKPIVPVRLEFAPSGDGKRVRMSANNLNRLGCELFSIRPEDVSDELFDELGKLVLRRENRFAEVTGHYDSSEVRQRLQARLNQERSADPEAEGRPVQTNAPQRRLHGSPVNIENRKSSRRLRRSAPTLIADDASTGWVNWDADQAGSVPGENTQSNATPQVALDAFVPHNRVATNECRYAWVITRDLRNEDPTESIAKRGPPGTSQAFPTPMVVNTGEDFRLLSDAGETLYHGMLVGKFEGLEPLTEFGRQRGCSQIEFLRDGQWVRFDASV